MNNKTELGNTALIHQASFLEQVVSQWYQAIDNEDSISLFLIDVDQFDEIRHKAGCMRKIISAIDAILNRDTDFITRFSRRKIMFVTSSMTYPQSRQLAERIHQVMATLALRQIEADSGAALITVSVGHITYSPVKDGSYGILDIISNVIKLCRQASHSGGNCSKTRLHSRLLN
ncbi:MAG: GGDEF domain-containing protein [Methylophaga sp.]|nr:GGDEF domain-containing protein [Methylophaga sp.]